MAKSPNKYDRKHLSQLSQLQRQVDAIYREAIKEGTRLAAQIGQISPDAAFSFDDYPQTRKRVESLLNGLKSGLESAIVNGIDASWTLANNKNSELARQVFGSYVGRLSQAQYRRYFSTNGAARDAFLARRESGLNLSDRVWNYTNQFRAELEQALDLGLRNGMAAEQMQRDLRQYLRNPDNFFRRYRYKEGVDEYGKPLYGHKWKKRYWDEASGKYRWEDVELSEYRYGRGVYRSSYKNARRLAATETNIAYKTADYMRWQELDFVVGIHIEPSGTNHPIVDICDELQGDYPKDFKFTGWHPHCRCFATSILKTPEEMEEDNRRIMEGEEPTEESVNSVTKMPDNFNKWVKENRESIERAKTLPYFLKDNKDYVQPVLDEAKAAAANAEAQKVETVSMNDVFRELIAEDVTTEKLLKENGEWVPKRKERHEKIIEKYIEGYDAKSDTVFMLGGAPANGKSTVVDSGLLPHPKGALVIDPDKIKGMLPEYKMMLRSGEKDIIKAAANFVHEESSYIGKEIQKRAFAKDIAVVIDGVNDGKFEKVVQKVKSIRSESGKRVRADYVSLDSDLSMKLAQIRAEKTGREVPADYIADMNKEISRLIPQLIENKTFDELYLWDTNENGNPRLILKQIDGKLTIVDESLYKRFLSKAN